MPKEIAAALIALSGVVVGYFVSPVVEILKDGLTKSGKRGEAVATLRFVLGYLEACRELLGKAVEHPGSKAAVASFAEFDLAPMSKSIRELASFYSRDTLRSGATQYLTKLLVILLARIRYLQQVIKDPAVSQQEKQDIELGISRRIEDLQVFLGAVYAKYMHVYPNSLIGQGSDIQNFEKDWTARRFEIMVENLDHQKQV